MGALSIAHKKARVIGAQTPQRAFYQTKAIMHQVTNINQAILTMTSREIAELVASRHDSVKRSMESLRDKGVISFTQSVETSHEGSGSRSVDVYVVNKRNSYIVVAQLCPEFTARLVDRWQELEDKQATPTVPQSLSAALRLAADQADLIEQQQAQLAIAAPKAAFVDAYVDATGLKGFREIAKLLKANEARLREFLSDRKIMYRLGGDWVAFQPHIDAGRFAVKAGASQINGHAFNRSLFTPKGIEWMAGLWAVHCLGDGAAV